MAGPRKKEQKPDLSGNCGHPITEAQVRKFLEQLSRVPNITRASEFAGFDRTYVYRRRQDDPEFEKLFQEAYRQGYEAMEEEAQRRAFSGFEEPLVYRGQITTKRDPKTKKEVPVTVTKFSDSLAMFLLKGNLSDKFKDRVETTNGNGGASRFSKLTDAELDAELERRLRNG